MFSRIKLLILASVLLLASQVSRADVSLTYSDSGQWTFNQDVAVQDTLLATTTAYGIQLYTTTTAEPTQLAKYYTSGHNAWATEIHGDRVYVTTVDGYLYVLDLDMNLLGATSGLGANPDIKLATESGTTLLYSAANASLDFQVKDVTNPASISAVGSLGLSGNTKYLALDTLNSVAYVATNGVVYAINIGNPASPSVLDNQSVSGTHIAISLQGNLAVVSSATAGFTVLDVGTPSNIQILSTVVPSAGLWPDANDPLPRVQSTALDGNCLYVVCNDVGLLEYDIATPGSPQLTLYNPVLDSVDPALPFYVFNQCTSDAETVYACHWGHWTAGAVAFDKADVGYSGRTRAYDYVRDTAANGSAVYGCSGNSGIVRHDVVDGELVYRSEFNIDEVWGADVVGDVVYAASTLYGLVVIDYSNPLAPVALDTVSVGQARSVLVYDNVAYVAAFSNGLSAVDVSDPQNCQVLDTYDTFSGTGPVNLDRVGNYLVSADRTYGVDVFSIVDPSSIQLVGNYNPTPEVLDVACTSGLVCYAVVGDKLQRINLYNPTSPVFVYEFGANATGVYVERQSVPGTTSLVYSTRGAYGLSVYDAGASSATEKAVFNTAKTAYASVNTLANGVYYALVADYAGLALLSQTITTKPGDPGPNPEGR